MKGGCADTNKEIIQRTLQKIIKRIIEEVGNKAQNSRNAPQNRDGEWTHARSLGMKVHSDVR